MKMILRPGVLGILVVCFAGPEAALATPKDYCEAYARDFADHGSKEEKIWASHHANALADCLFQFQPTRTEPAKAAAPKVVKQAAKQPPAKRTKVKARAEPAPEAEIAEPLPDPAVIVAPDIEPPQKSAKSSKTVAKVVIPAAQSAKKTLLAKFFPRASAAPAAPGKAAPGKLVRGSSAWLDYCERKYASFNRDTGTYKSYKGVERKCLVTN